MVDFYTDTNQSLLKSFLRNNSELVGNLEKTASEGGEFIPKEELTKEAFADSVNRMFPIYDKNIANITAMYIMAQADEVPYYVKEAAQEACNIFGLDYDLVGFEKAASVQDELDSSDFIFPETKKLPVVDEETFNLSESVFLKVAEELSPEDVILGARRLIKKAEEFNLNYDKTLNKLGLVNGVDLYKLAELAQDVSLVFSGEEVPEEIETLIKTASSETVNITPEDSAYAAVELIKHVNEKTGMSKTASLLYKIAAENKLDYVSLDGYNIPVDKIASIPEDEWREVLPYEEIAHFNDGSFDKKAFEELVGNMTPHEQDIIYGFIQKYI